MLACKGHALPRDHWFFWWKCRLPHVYLIVFFGPIIFWLYRLKNLQKNSSFSLVQKAEMTTLSEPKANFAREIGWMLSHASVLQALFFYTYNKGILLSGEKQLLSHRNQHSRVSWDEWSLWSCSESGASSWNQQVIGNTGSVSGQSSCKLFCLCGCIGWHIMALTE